MKLTYDHPLVIIPTYNERENLARIVQRIRGAVPGAHLLIVDDASPDGTGAIADDLAADDPWHVHVLHRQLKEGLGAAYLAGFAWGMARSYDVFVEMDADGSHPPEQLRRLLDAVNAGADLAIGSRYVTGGEVQNWPLRRLVLSRTANLYSRLMLGTDIRDITAGYRAFRRSTLIAIGCDTVSSQGYCFQIDMAWRTTQLGLSVVEVPITFVERERGVSKMSGATIWDSLTSVARWGIASRRDALRSRQTPLSRVSAE